MSSSSLPANSNSELEEARVLREEIAALERAVNFQTSLTLSNLAQQDLESILFNDKFLEPQQTDAHISFRILITLKLLLARSEEDKEEEEEEGNHPQILLEANRADITLRQVLHLCCEYWGIAPNDALVLLTEHGVWRELESRVMEIEPPSFPSSSTSRMLPTTVLLFLDEKPASLHDTRARLQMGDALLQQDGLNAQRSIITAPVLMMNTADLVNHAGPRSSKQQEETKPPDDAHKRANLFMRARRLVKNHVRGLQDPFLFSTRRWLLDLAISIGLVCILSIYIVSSLPNYPAASSLFSRIEEEMFAADNNPLLWMMDSPSFTAFFANDFYGLGQSRLVGELALYQNRVDLTPGGIAPSYSSSTEQTKPLVWFGTEWTDTNATFTGQFATYGRFAYLARIPSQASPGLRNQMLNELLASNWFDNATRLIRLEFDILNHNFNDTVHYGLLVEQDATGLTRITTRVKVFSPTTNEANAAWFVFFASLFLVFIALDLARTAYFARQTKLSAIALWRALSLRSTVLNPLIFILGVVGAAIPNLVLLALCNILVCVKLYTYFPLPLRACTREYGARVIGNLVALLLVMLICMCGFAWLLVTVPSTAGASRSGFPASFMHVAKKLVAGVLPVWWELPLTTCFVSIASQLVLNILLYRLALPVAYAGME